MPIAGSIFLIAVGAILRYATNIHVKGVSIDTVGLILMIAGAAALVLSLLQELIWSRRTRPVEAPVADERVPAVEERREVREPPRY
jgi:hypothetical protein